MRDPVTNNLRDIGGDADAGKVTLAVRIGDHATRRLYAALVAGALLMPIVLAFMTTPWVALAVVSGLLAVRPLRVVLGGALGPALIPALKLTGVLLLCYGILLGLLLALA